MVLGELAAGSGRTTARLSAPGADEITPDFWSPDTTVRLLECDHRISAGLGVIGGSPSVELGRHPWSRLTPPDGPVVAETPPSESLLITGLVYRPPRPKTRLPAAWLSATARRACQRAGARRIVAFVPTHPPDDGADWSPEAFVQQLYFGAIEDRELSPFLAADFVPRGLASPADFPFDQWRTVVVWENSRR